MRIKVLDVNEHHMHLAETRFKDQVIIDDDLTEPGNYNLTFKKGCTLSTHNDPVEQLFIYNADISACICFFDTDFSEVHII